MKVQGIVLQTVVKILLPFIQIYGFYIIFHGHVSPGGGFAGGAVLAASFILFALANDVEAGFDRFPRLAAKWLESLGGLCFILLGAVGILRGAEYLANIPQWLGRAGDLFSAGIIPLLTLAVGIKVCSTVVTLFYNLLEDGSHDGKIN
jgi:multicomponent Na+:H+ antiporter subunit B